MEYLLLFSYCLFYLPCVHDGFPTRARRALGKLQERCAQGGSKPGLRMAAGDWRRNRFCAGLQKPPEHLIDVWPVVEDAGLLTASVQSVALFLYAHYLAYCIGEAVDEAAFNPLQKVSISR